MGRWSLGLLLYAAVALGCDDEPSPNVGDTGVEGGDSGIGDDDTGTAGGDTGAVVDTGVNDGGNNNGDANPNDTGSMIDDECNPVDQTGCDNAPQTKCVIEGGAPGTECVEPSPNDVDFGDVCTGQDCAGGLVCLRDAPTSTQASCRKACDLDTNVGCEALPGEYECRTSITMSNWGACTMLPPLCDPNTQAPCDAMQACQPFLRRTGTWEFRCRTAGVAAEGMPCGGGTGCMRGLACVTDNGAATCKRYCTGDGDCTSPLTCTGMVPEPPFMFCDM